MEDWREKEYKNERARPKYFRYPTSEKQKCQEETQRNGEHQRSHSREKTKSKDKTCYWLCLKDEIVGAFSPLLYLFLYFPNFL